MKSHACLLKVTAMLIVFASTPLLAGDWPQWRGPRRDGQFIGPAWPDKLDTNHLRKVWRVELGPSYSGPIVSGTRVFTTETKDKKFEAVTAFDRKTGRELWRTQWEGALGVPFFAKSNGDWIRATPACDGESLFVAGMRDGVAYTHLKSQRVMAIEVETGRELWTSGSSFGKYWSLVAQGGRILGLDQRGVLFLLRANKEKFELLDQRKLADTETWAHLAAADDELFTRELNPLTVYRWGESGAASEEAPPSNP